MEIMTDWHARVSQIISADCLILLSDVDGLYTDNP